MERGLEDVGGVLVEGSCRDASVSTAGKSTKTQTLSEGKAKQNGEQQTPTTHRMNTSYMTK